MAKVINFHSNYLSQSDSQTLRKFVTLTLNILPLTPNHAPNLIPNIAWPAGRRCCRLRRYQVPKQ